LGAWLSGSWELASEGKRAIGGTLGARAPIMGGAGWTEAVVTTFTVTSL